MVHSVHWSLMGGLLHLVQRGGDWEGYAARQARPRCIAHPSTAGIPIIVLLYNSPLLCGFNVPIKWLILVNTIVCPADGRGGEQCEGARFQRLQFVVNQSSSYEYN